MSEELDLVDITNLKVTNNRTLSCLSADSLPDDYDTITINDTF